MDDSRDTYVLIGGCLLAFGASFVNVVALLELSTSVAHLTGDTARLAVDLSSGAAGHARDEAVRVATAVAAFMGGALISGFVIHQPNLELSKPYGRVVIGIGALLVGASLMATTRPVGAVAAAALACGLQNAMATRYGQVILRTTHVTGLLTDLGVALGIKLRGGRVPTHGLIVPALVCSAFFAGALVGGYVVRTFAAAWLTWAGVTYMVGGAVWSVLKRTVLSAAARRA